MLAKVIRNRPLEGNRRQSLPRWVGYMCGKASTVILADLAGCRPSAVEQRKYTARLNERIRTPVYHRVLS